MNWLRSKLRLWLGIDKLEARVLDLERHFVTKRGEAGEILETLADVPIDKRKERANKMRGMSIQQRIAWAEKTDGGRLV
jgi:hypothetical protein